MASEQQLERSMLDGKDREELHAIAGAMGVKGITRLRKADLVDAILGGGRGPGRAGRQRREGDEGHRERLRRGEAEAGGPVEEGLRAGGTRQQHRGAGRRGRGVGVGRGRHRGRAASDPPCRTGDRLMPSPRRSRPVTLRPRPPRRCHAATPRTSGRRTATATAPGRAAGVVAAVTAGESARATSACPTAVASRASASTAASRSRSRGSSTCATRATASCARADTSPVATTCTSPPPRCGASCCARVTTSRARRDPPASNEKYPALAPGRPDQRRQPRRRPRTAAVRGPHPAVPGRAPPPRARWTSRACSPAGSSSSSRRSARASAASSSRRRRRARRRS